MLSTSTRPHRPRPFPPSPAPCMAPRRRQSDLCTRPLPTRRQSAAAESARRASEPAFSPPAASAACEAVAGKEEEGAGHDAEHLPLRLQLHWLAVRERRDVGRGNKGPRRNPPAPPHPPSSRFQHAHTCQAGDQPLRTTNINAARLIGCLVANDYEVTHGVCASMSGPAARHGAAGQLARCSSARSPALSCQPPFPRSRILTFRFPFLFRFRKSRGFSH